MKYIPTAGSEKVVDSLLTELKNALDYGELGQNVKQALAEALRLAENTLTPVVIDLPVMGIDVAGKDAILFPHVDEQGSVEGYNLHFRAINKGISGSDKSNPPVRSVIPVNNDPDSLDWLIAIDAQGFIDFISSAGLSSSRFSGKKPEDFFRPEVTRAYHNLLNGIENEDAGFNIYINQVTNGHFIVISGINPFIRAEELYARSQQFINYVFDNIPTDIAIWSLDHKYLYTNSIAINNPEIREWINGKTDFDYCDLRSLPYSMAAERRNMFNLALATNKPQQWIETLETPQGDKHLLRVYDTIHDKHGNPMLMAGYAMDITGRINSEIAFQKIVQANNLASDGIALCDKNGDFFYMNQKHAEIFDYQHPEELIGKSWKTLYPESEIKRIEDVAMKQLVRDGNWTGITYGWGKSGRIIVQEISLTTTGNGEIICICRDISDRMRQSEEMRKLAIVAKHTLSSVVIMDTQFRIEWVNNTFLNRTGLTMEDVKGSKAELLFNIPEERAKVLDAFRKLESGQAQSGELLLKNRKGKDVWIYASVAPVFDETGNLVNYISVDSDITMYKQAQEQLVKSLRMEKALSETKSRFVSLASHELRTPLMSLQARLDISRLHAIQGGTAEMMITQFDLIQHEINRITEILDKVLIAGKLGRGNFTATKIETDPASRLLQIAEKLTIKEYTNHQFELEQRGNTNLQLQTDPAYFDHIFNNLLSNSAKFSGSHHVTRVLLNYTASQLTITVSDRGIGIPPEDLPEIFNLFHRGSNAQNIRGTGLGLYIVKYFVNLLGGTVVVDSALNKGTSFTVTLPYS